MPSVIPAPITTTVERTEVVCLCCARVAGHVQGGVLSAARPEHAASVWQLVCPTCGGRLISGESYPVRLLRPLTAAERDERQAQRPKRAPEPRPIPRPRKAPGRPSMLPCPECRERFIQPQRTRCQPCDAEHRRAEGVYGRLVDFLRCSEPLRTRALAAMLGCSPDTVRQVVHAARRRGVPIVSVGKRYRLALQPPCIDCGVRPREKDRRVCRACLDKKRPIRPRPPCLVCRERPARQGGRKCSSCHAKHLRGRLKTGAAS